MSEEVKYYYDERGFGTILINRPHKRNAISVQIAKVLNELLDRLKNEEMKFLVLKSADGNVFCAGGDLNDLNGELTEREAYEDLKHMKEAIYKIVSFPVPTICLLHGTALGGGCELATAFDFRIAKEGTSFGFVQANLGIIPGWGGGAVLYERVLPSFAYHWLMEAEIYDATFLKEKGWIDEVVTDSDWNEDYLLRKYLKRSPKQMRHLKAQYLEEIDIESLFAKMNKESARCASLWESEEHQDIVRQFLSRKKL